MNKLLKQWFSTSGPWLLVLISTNKENITEIEKNITQLGHRPLCILKMGHAGVYKQVSNGILADCDVVLFTGEVKTFFWRSTSPLCYNQRRNRKFFLPDKFFILCIS